MFETIGMIEVLLVFWILSALFIIRENRVIRIFVYFGISSLITSVCYLLLGSPDVAMAEAAVSAFTTVFFIVCFEKYYNFAASNETAPPKISFAKRLKIMAKYAPHALFCVLLFALFVVHIPTAEPNTYLRDLYIAYSIADIGGENAVGAILLGYRVFDTLFEALILVVAVVAVIHMSRHTIDSIDNGKISEISQSGMAIFIIRVVCPLILMFGIYLMANGHISPGGGFQGGLAIAAFFICRYMVYNIYDIPILKVIKLEEIIFIGTVLLAIFVVFLGATEFIPIFDLDPFQNIYLIAMNFLIGLKVTCGFIILFYRYIAIERLDNCTIPCEKTGTRGGCERCIFAKVGGIKR